MAIAVDSRNAGGDSDTNEAATSITWAHTCTGANLILIVGCMLRNNTSQTITGVTYNAVAMTRVCTVADGTNRRVYLWALINPATGAHDIVVTASAATAAMTGGSISLTGAHQTAGWRGGASADTGQTDSGTAATDPDIVVTSAAGEWAVDVVGWTIGDSPMAADGSQTEYFHRQDAGAITRIAAGSDEAAVGASTTMSWAKTGTTTAWVQCGLSVQPAAEAAATPPRASIITQARERAATW